VAVVLGNLGWLEHAQGNFADASALHRSALELWRESGNDEGAATSLAWHAWTARCAGDYVAAKALGYESRDLAEEIGSRSALGLALRALGLVQADLGDAHGAADLLGHCLAVFKTHGGLRALLEPVEGLADVALLTNRPAVAMKLVAAADLFWREKSWTRDYTDRKDWERRVGKARSKLDADAFAMAWAEGRAFSLEELYFLRACRRGVESKRLRRGLNAIAVLRIAPQRTVGPRPRSFCAIAQGSGFEQPFAAGELGRPCAHWTGATLRLSGGLHRSSVP